MIEFLVLTMYMTGWLLILLFFLAIFSGMINLLIDPGVLLCTFLCSALLVACVT